MEASHVNPSINIDLEKEIAKHYQEVKSNVLSACEKVNRDASEITIIAVSKTQPKEVMMAAQSAGIHVYGENKVQELLVKQPYMGENTVWHMIGHLQTNKVKQIVGKVDLIHSVDSIRLLQAIDKEAKKQGVVADILLEVNVAEEDSKFGLTVAEVLPLVRQAPLYSHVRIKGLMTIAPFVDNSEKNRPIFNHLRKLSVDIMHEKIDNVTMSVLSMGMTNDYSVAIEEGATMVRVGTGIFGAIG